MNRTLRRPMFRIGGTAEGITSGLQPRQGYAHKPGHVKPNDPQKLGDIRNMDIGQLKELAGTMSYRPRGTNVYDFMTEFGLDIASRPPVPGGILATAATSAKEPYQRFMQRKGEADLQEYASESDMFKTLIGAQADILGSEGGSRQFSKEQAANAMAGFMGEWHDLRDKKDSMDAQEWSDQKDILWSQIYQYQKENPAVASLFEDKDYAVAVKTKIKMQLKKSQKMIDTDGDGAADMTEAQWYSTGGKDLLMLEVGKRYLEFYEEIKLFGSSTELKAEGGRIGYQGGNAVMPGATQAKSTGGYDTSGLPGYDMEGGFQPSNLQGFPEQGEAMPEELSGITFEELRARLPQEVGDDIVRLLANSSEALEDFATIQTEQDIANFNKKYGVNLVLPSGG